MKNTEQAPARRRLLPWAVTITLASFVAGGGIAAAATMSGGTSASPPTTPTTPVSQVATSNAPDVSSLLAASNTPATLGRNPLGRLRRVGGMHGQVTYRGTDGRVHTLAFERGTITAVTSSDIVVRAQDGTSTTWILVKNTVIREHGTKTTTAALHEGEQVFTGGPVTAGASDARLIVIRASKAVTS